MIPLQGVQDATCYAVWPKKEALQLYAKYEPRLNPETENDLLFS